MVDPWRFQAHPEVWFLVASVVGLAAYAVRVIGPKVVPVGQRVVTPAQRRFFVAGVATLWLASDWPIHDIGEEHLYSVHMAQHLLLTLVMPPLVLLAMPEWFARLVTSGSGAFARVVRMLSRPILAGLLFAAVQFITHWPTLVNGSVESGPIHYLVHLAVVSTALLMWMPVCGPIPEWRMSIPAQVFYLFVISILPTVPSGWLIFAETPVYSVYDHALRLWDIDVITDQQTAGVIMKLAGGMFLWSVITFLFFRWALRHEEADRRGIRATERQILTWDQVAAELDATDPIDAAEVAASRARGGSRSLPADKQTPHATEVTPTDETDVGTP